MSVRGGGGYSNIFIHAYMYGLEQNIFGFKILKFKSLGGFKKFQIFIWECPDIPDIFRLGKTVDAGSKPTSGGGGGGAGAFVCRKI